MRIAINIIATGNYLSFVHPLAESIDKYFLTEHDVFINLFTDSNKEYPHTYNRIKIIQYAIPSYKFPEATLLRYHIMTSIEYDCDFIYYLDADMLINMSIGEEILGDIVAVRHPGYFIEKNSGAWETRPESQAYVAPADRKKYFCGGFQGGSKDCFYSAMVEMREAIQIDIDNGIMPIYHDESMFNKFLIGKEYKELDCSCCMPQAWAKRVYSKIQNMPARILALEKDFEYIRS